MRFDLAFAALLLSAAGAAAHVGLVEPNAAPGAQYTAQFRVGHGCSGSPTTALRVEIPPGIDAVTPQAPPGWSVATERQGARVSAVTWTGGPLAGDKPGPFTATMRLPTKAGQLAF